MGKTSMRMIKPKLQAETITNKTEIDNYIKSVYDGIADKSTLKYLPSFILFVCCVVEECYSKKSVHQSKISKKDEVIQHIFAFLEQRPNENDNIIISAIIEDLHSSGRIKRVSLVQKIVFTIGNFFLNKG